jgi:hypothetical protein
MGYKPKMGCGFGAKHLDNIKGGALLKINAMVKPDQKSFD